MLIFINVLYGQKPSIKLLPSSHHNMHPEAMIDTSLANDTLLKYIPSPLPKYFDIDPGKAGPEKKVRRQIGPSFDSIFNFNKEETERITSGIRSKRFPLHMKFLNPINLFIHITALK